MNEAKDHRPAGHPALPTDRIGVLIANLGTPDGHGYWPMRRYLSEFLSDRRVIDYPWWRWQPVLQTAVLARRPFTSGAGYRSIWNEAANESPLMTITRAQTARLAEALAARHGDRVVVAFAMRYGNPSTASRVGELARAGCRRILFFPLYPQYAGATTATANDAFFRALTARDLKWQPAVRTVGPYFDRPDYVAALAGSLRAGLAEGAPPQAVVASYHGLPARYLDEGDPYHCQCMKTTRLLAAELGWDPTEIVTAFQSRFGPEEWLRPYTVDEVARLARAGKTSIAVIAPAFAADCIETLEEIEGEIRQSFVAAGGRVFRYIPCLNDAPDHIALLADIIEENLGGWL